MTRNQRLTGAAFLLVGSVSLVLISGLDYQSYWFLARAAPPLKLVPAIRVTSLTACALLCVLFGGQHFNPRDGTHPGVLFGSPQRRGFAAESSPYLIFRIWTPTLQACRLAPSEPRVYYLAFSIFDIKLGASRRHHLSRSPPPSCSASGEHGAAAYGFPSRCILLTTSSRSSTRPLGDWCSV